ncbi:MAG: site-specific DNA-methyltransferase, partial [Muribaculaceae bacterium]|nr:site-specific DNA-methyltransferase [Muribaculaceae bacterium]
WHSRQSLQNDTDLSVIHEYLLCYAKNRRKSNRRLKASNADRWFAEDGFVFYPIKVDNSKYSNPDNDPRGPWKADPMDAPHVRPNLTYTITNPKTGTQHLPPRGRCWRISQEKFSSALADNRILFGKNGDSRPQMKVFLYEQELYGSISHSWFEAEQYGTATHGSKELQTIFGGEKMFTSPKPTALIRELLKLTSLPSNPVTVLDFFAGSGTTLHAVMQLNAEDGGKRQCILCTNNENRICENVTYERNKRVINGYTKPNGEHVKGLHDNNLRYYKTDFISRTRTMKNMHKLVALATDMLCIKENLYTEQKRMNGVRTHHQIFRYFDDGKKQMLIIYREEYIEEIVGIIEKMDIKNPMRVYVFSPSEDPATLLFESVEDKVRLTALPAAIYNVYKRILPKKRDKVIFVDKGKEDNETESIGGLFRKGGEK